MKVTITQDSFEVTDREEGDLSDEDLHRVIRAGGRQIERLFDDLFGPRPERNWAEGQGAVIYGP